MKTVRVVAAVIRDRSESGTRILATERGYGDFKGKWEFPGGKIEPGETPQQALMREIREELDVTITVDKLIDTVEYDYPAFHLSMDCFWCFIEDGEIMLKEALDARWISVNALPSNDHAADCLLRKAVEAKLAFSVDDLIGFLNFNDKALAAEAIYNSANRLTSEDMEKLYGEVDDEEERPLEAEPFQAAPLKEQSLQSEAFLTI